MRGFVRPRIYLVGQVIHRAEAPSAVGTLFQRIFITPNSQSLSH